MAKQSKLHGSHLKLARIWLHREERATFVLAYDVRPEVFAPVPYTVGKCHVHREYYADGRKASTWAVTDAYTGACIVRNRRSPDAAVRGAVERLASKSEAEYLGARNKRVEEQAAARARDVVGIANGAAA